MNLKIKIKLNQMVLVVMVFMSIVPEWKKEPVSYHGFLVKYPNRQRLTAANNPHICWE